MTPEIISSVLNHVDQWVWWIYVIKPLVENIDLVVVLSTGFAMVGYMFKSSQDWERVKVMLDREENKRQRGDGA